MKFYLVKILIFFGLITFEEARAGGIVATITPIHSIVSGVVGDTLNVNLMVPGIVSPHTYTLKPSQRRLLDEADIVFLIDKNFETFLAKTLEVLPENVRVVSLSNADGLNILKYREGGVWEAHAHSDGDEHEHHDHGHGHEHGKDKHDGHDTHAMDLHFWLDPQNAIVLTKIVAKELGKMYPESRMSFKRNAKKQIQAFENLDKKLETSLKVINQRPFMVFHDAYQYFENRYGLNAVGSITVNPDRPISAKRIKEVRTKLAQSGATCIFSEPQFNNKLVDTVIEGLDVKSAVIDPLGVDEKPGEALYPAMMQKLALNLTKCLG